MQETVALGALFRSKLGRRSPWRTLHSYLWLSGTTGPFSHRRLGSFWREISPSVTGRDGKGDLGVHCVTLFSAGELSPVWLL